jgi:hypothetical protein
MNPIELLQQFRGLDSSREMARSLASKRGFKFNDDRATARRALGGVATGARVARDRLPRAAGIYLIHCTETGKWYVGLAQDIAERFNNKYYGHLAGKNQTCLAHEVMERCSFEIFVVEQLDDDGDDISCAEIDWYFLLICSGCELTNAEGALGKKGSDGTPIVSCNLKNGEHRLFASQQEAAILGLQQNEVAMCVSGGNRQAKGHAHRRATADEVAKWAVDDAPATFEAGRWVKGSLTAENRKELLRSGRGSYEDHTDKGAHKFVGVSYVKNRVAGSGRWQASCYTGRDPAKGGTKTLKYVGTYPDQCAAAKKREEYIVKNRLQDYNTSNAKRLNEVAGRATFDGW